MPKANNKDAYYFPHDCNARNDPKILALRSVYGAEGYGIYWMLIEILREQPDYKLPVSKYIWNALAMQMQCNADTVQKVIEDCCTEFCDGGKPLLVNDGQFLYSTSLIRRMERVDNLSVRRREAAKKRWESTARANAMQMHSKCNASAEQVQSKENKIKENKIKEDKRKEDKRRSIQDSISDPFTSFSGDDTELLSALHDFEAMRKAIKKPMTERAKALLVKRLSKLTTDRTQMIQILDQSITHNWQDVYPLKEDYSGKQNGNGNVFLELLEERRQAR
jgi:hypothetical protein